MFYYIFVIFAVLAGISAVPPDDEFHVLITQAAEECYPKFGLDAEKFREAQKNKEFEKIDPCLLACILKKHDIITDQGMFDDEQAMKVAKETISSSEILDKIGKTIAICRSVNEVKASDDKGCLRAVHLFGCFDESRKKLGY